MRYCAGWTEKRVGEALYTGNTEARVCHLTSGNHRVCAQLDHARLIAIPYTQENNQWVQDSGKTPINISPASGNLEDTLREIAERFFLNFGWESLESKRTCEEVLANLEESPLESRVGLLECYYYKDEMQAARGCTGIMVITCWDGTLEIPYLDCPTGALLLVALAKVIPDNAMASAVVAVKKKVGHLGGLIPKLRWKNFCEFINSK